MVYELGGDQCNYVCDWKDTAGAVPHAFGVYALEFGAAVGFRSSGLGLNLWRVYVWLNMVWSTKGQDTLLQACKQILQQLDPVSSINNCDSCIDVS